MCVLSSLTYVYLVVCFNTKKEAEIITYNNKKSLEMPIFQQKLNVILEDGCLIDNRKPVCVGNGAME